jgi:hypothetical protein
MLPERLSQLLTAYIDGEMSARRRRAVERLLESSAEARTVLRQLQQDSAILHNLPRRQLAADFPNRVLGTIADRHLGPRRRLTLQPSAPFPAWVGLAVAASVLFCVGIGSYLHVVAEQRQWADMDAGASHDRDGNSSAEKRPPADSPIIAEGNAPDTPKPDTSPKPPETALADSEPKVAAPSPKAVEQGDGRSRNTELAVPTPRTEGLQVVTKGVALRLALRDLDQQPSRQRLRQELQKENAFRLELFCQGNGKAIERLQTAFHSQGIRLLVDAEAQARSKNRRVRSDYALYADGLAASELAQILQQLGSADKLAAARRPGDGQFDMILVLPLTPADRKELAALLGCDPTPALVPKARAPLGVDVTKPISQKTAEQVAQALEGKGPPRPQPGHPVSVKTSERLALILPYNPAPLKPGASREVKQFLEGRKNRTAGGCQVLVVLRGANG